MISPVRQQMVTKVYISSLRFFPAEGPPDNQVILLEGNTFPSSRPAKMKLITCSFGGLLVREACDSNTQSAAQ